MGAFELYDREPSSTPKLSLFSFPANRVHESPGMMTPPVHAVARVPFHWEEAPGKPRPCHGESKPGKVARCLELPPRLHVPEADNSPSPTTVLDGPYVFRSMSMRSLSCRRRAASSRDKGLFGSRRWGSFRKTKGPSDGGFEFLSSSYDGAAKVKTGKLRRRSSFLSLYQTKSRLWVSIYERLKQVIPWKRREEKARRMSSPISTA